MEKKLRHLFDYQKFQKNPRLEAMLVEAEGRCAEVSDDDLELVSAAGDWRNEDTHIQWIPSDQIIT